MPQTTSLDHAVSSREEWLKAQQAFLAKEKELTHLSDQLARQRRELPWVRVDKQYLFSGRDGKLSLADLFHDQSQLAVYHFMFGPDWEEGCPGCSYLMDHMNGSVEHLRARDVSFMLVSRASIEKITAFRQRMGWKLPWVSSGGNDFNRDFGVYFTKEEVASGQNQYNFATIPPHGEENPGMSLFYKSPSGEIFHTYSAFGRGLESMLGTYAVLDRAPKGRDEDSLPQPMQWVRHHDKYQPALRATSSCCHGSDCH